MTVMSRLDTRLQLRSKQINFFAEFLTMDDLGKFIDMIRQKGYKLHDLEINRAKSSANDLVGATFWVELDRKMDHVELIREFSGFSGVKYLEELEFM